MEWHKIKIERKPKKMTRRLRKNVESSFLHILVQGVNKEFIFLENKDIEKYQSLLFKIKKEYELKIVAYCIMHNHAHILLYAEENKTLSKFMHIVNTYYAIITTRNMLVWAMFFAIDLKVRKYLQKNIYIIVLIIFIEIL